MNKLYSVALSVMLFALFATPASAQFNFSGFNSDQFGSFDASSITQQVSSNEFSAFDFGQFDQFTQGSGGADFSGFNFDEFPKFPKFPMEAFAVFDNFGEYFGAENFDMNGGNWSQGNVQGSIGGAQSEEAKAGACEQVVAKLNSKLASYDQQVDQMLIRYETARDRALTRADELEAQGYDLSEARQLVDEIDSQVNELVSEADAVEAKWSGRKIDCSDASQVKALQEEAQADIDSLQEIVGEIRANIQSIMAVVRNAIGSRQR